jgi:hypothetical protein
LGGRRATENHAMMPTTRQRAASAYTERTHERPVASGGE